MNLARIFPLIGGGFLLAVLWFDLKFDWLAYSHMTQGSGIDAQAIASIKAYYAQALAMESRGFPLIVTMMLLSIAALLLQYKDRYLVRWSWVVSLLLLLPPILLAALRVVPNAKKLAFFNADHLYQVNLASAILQDHLFCFSAISCFLVLQLYRAGESRSAEIST